MPLSQMSPTKISTWTNVIQLTAPRGDKCVEFDGTGRPAAMVVSSRRAGHEPSTSALWPVDT
uniref:Uncharacterized protein n=1 Tax=Leersia perrieri TaxID=77586 RepID=A0A0D9V3S6_9ORYZ